MGQKNFTPLKNKASSWLSALGLVLLTLCFTSPSVQAQISVGTIVTNVSCSGGSDGEITAQVFGGWPPYTYVWSTGDTTATITGLPAGTYTVSVTDKDLAFNFSVATVFEPAPLGIYSPAFCYLWSCWWIYSINRFPRNSTIYICLE